MGQCQGSRVEHNSLLILCPTRASHRLISGQRCVDVGVSPRTHELRQSLTWHSILAPDKMKAAWRVLCSTDLTKRVCDSPAALGRPRTGAGLCVQLVGAIDAPVLQGCR